MLSIHFECFKFNQRNDNAFLCYYPNTWVKKFCTGDTLVKNIFIFPCMMRLNTIIIFLLFLVQLVFCSSSSSIFEDFDRKLNSEELKNTNLCESRKQLVKDISKEAEKQGIHFHRSKVEIKNWPEFIPRSSFNWDMEALKTIREVLPTLIFNRKDVIADQDSSKKRNEHNFNRNKLIGLLHEKYFEQIGGTIADSKTMWLKYHIKGWPRNSSIISSYWTCIDVMKIYRQLKNIEFIPVKPGENRTVTYCDGHVKEFFGANSYEKNNENSLKRKSMSKIESESTRICNRNSKSESENENGTEPEKIELSQEFEVEDAQKNIIITENIKDTKFRGDTEDWIFQENDSNSDLDAEIYDYFAPRNQDFGSCSSDIAQSSDMNTFAPVIEEQSFLKVLNDFKYGDENDLSVQEILKNYDLKSDSLFESESSDVFFAF